MQFDIDKIQNKFDNSEELMEENARCLKRMEVLESLQKSRIEEEIVKEFIHDFECILSQASIDNTLKNQSTSLKTCIQQLDSHEKGISRMVDSIVKRKYYHDVDKMLDEL
jgi:hypothetical protein